MDPTDIGKNYNTMSQGIRDYNEGQQDYLQAESNSVNKDTNIQWESDIREFIDREKTILTVGSIVMAVMVLATLMLLPRMKLR